MEINEKKEALRLEILKYIEKHSRVLRWRRRRSSAAIIR